MDCFESKVSEKQSTSAKDLEQEVKEVRVHGLSAEYYRSLVEGMPKHLKAVIKAREGPKKC